MDIHLRDTIRSWGFPLSFSMSPTSLEGVPKFLENVQSFPREMICPIQFPRCFPLFSLGFISSSSSVRGIFRLFIPYSTCFLGLSPNFSEGLIRSRECHPWKSSPCLLFLLSLDKWGLYGLIPFYLTGFLGCPPFLLFCEEERIKIELIEEFVSSVLRGFYCRLTFSRSDFAKWHTLYLWLLFKKLVGVVKEVIRLYSCLLVISTPYYDP